MRNTYKILVKNPIDNKSFADLNLDWKVKVNLSLCLTKHHGTKPNGEVEYGSTHF
jgi:hypothetical protein